MIENVTWHLGGIASMSDVATVYAAERGTAVYSSRPTDTTGYIGLMYPSDFGYSVLSTSCLRTKSLGSYYTAVCGGSAWLRGEGIEWALMPSSSSGYVGWFLERSARINSGNLLYGYAVRPALYLKSNTMKLWGSGTALDPYIIVAS